MKEIFVFPASNNEAQKHLQETIEKSIDKNQLLKYLDKKQLSQFPDPNNQEEFYCWGATPRLRNEENWEK